MYMFFGAYDCPATLADNQFFFLEFNELIPVEMGKIKNLIGKFYPLFGNAMFFALTTENTLTVIPSDRSGSLLFIIDKSDRHWRAYIGTGFATHTVFVIDNRFSPESFEWFMGLKRERGSISR
jgi:hypothetical protein